MSKYKYQLLEETSETQDLFEEKTHEKIADALYQTICSQESGVSIGLEGTWGSGKSTVINLFKEKIEKQKGKEPFLYFYFDAWEHEGDPLRRIFLEDLVRQLVKQKADKKEALEKIGKELSDKKKTQTTKSVQKPTCFAKILGFSSLLLPLGAAIVSGTAEHITFCYTGSINWLFFLGFLICLFPIVWIFIEWHRHGKNFSLLSGEHTTISEQELTDHNERSSVDFEKYFFEILALALDGKQKLILVIDNLDRIDPSDSRKIWSTMQTFLQNRNPVDFERTDKIWTIVPYDEEGLAKIWQNDNHNENAIVDSCAKSFFDKCFQLRFEVPKLVISSWESFCSVSMNKALFSWPKSDREIALDMLKLTRESPIDCPSPREIKTYVNQIGSLRYVYEDNYNLKTICLYVIYKNLKRVTRGEWEEKLRDQSLISEDLANVLKFNVYEQLAGLFYGVSAEKGSQILLIPLLEKGIKSDDVDILNTAFSGLIEIHGETFWTVFDYWIRTKEDPSFWGMCSQVFLKDASKYHEGYLTFSTFLYHQSKKWNAYSFDRRGNKDRFKSMLLLLKETNNDNSHLVNILSKEISKNINNKDWKNFQDSIQDIITLQTSATDKNAANIDTQEFTLNAWHGLISADPENKVVSKLRVNDALVAQIKSSIKPNVSIPETLTNVLQFLVLQHNKDLISLIEPIKAHIQYNNGAINGTSHSFQSIHIVFLLAFGGKELCDQVQSVLSLGSYWNLVLSLGKEKTIQVAALTLVMAYEGNINNCTIKIPVPPPYQVKSQQALNETMQWWTQENQGNVDYAWTSIKDRIEFSFVWTLALNSTNKLVGKIIEKAMAEKKKDFFLSLETYDQYKKACLLLSDASRENFADSVAQFSSIPQILCAKNFVLEFPISKEFVQLFLAIKDNEAVHNNVVEKILNAEHTENSEFWKKTFDSFEPMFHLLNALKDVERQKILQTSFSDKLSERLELVADNFAKSDPKQREMLDDAFQWIGEDFKIDIKKQISDFLIAKKMLFPEASLSYLLKYVDLERFLSDKKSTIQDFIKDTLKKQSEPELRIIESFIDKNFEPEEGWGKILEEPLQVWARKDISKELKERLSKIADFFHVALKEVPAPKDDENSEPTKA